MTQNRPPVALSAEPRGLSETSGPATSTPQVRVWAPLVRVFHWSLAGGFALAFVTKDDLLGPHIWAGYLVLARVVFRLVWGFVGPRYARWADFVKEPGEITACLRAIASFRAERHLGHNPAGGAMVVALLLALVATGLSGLAVYGVQELSGPLAPLMRGLPGA